MKSIDKSRLRFEALRLIDGEVGHTEQPFRSNNGPHVRKYLAHFDKKPPAEWCAALVSWCYSVGAINLGLELPFTPSLGAGALIRAVGRVGRLFTDPEQVVPGDLVGWYRGPLGRLDWRRHVGMITALGNTGDGRLQVTAGNEGRNGEVRQRWGRFHLEPRFYTFASIHQAKV